LEPTKIINLNEKTKVAGKKRKRIKNARINQITRAKENLITSKNLKEKKNLRRSTANLRKKKKTTVNDTLKRY
jgi:hypothetical protein